MTPGERTVDVEERWGEGLPPGPARRLWLRTAGVVGWVLLCSLLGALLLVLPWAPVWERNYFASQVPGWSAFWLSPYWRGAVSGLGLVNVGISFCELLRLWRVWWPVR